MATTFDVVQLEDDDLSEGHESLEALEEDAEAGPVSDVEEEDESAGAWALPGGELVADELITRVVPVQHDEFTCTSCFLVHHRSQRVTRRDGSHVCAECA